MRWHPHAARPDQVRHPLPLTPVLPLGRTAISDDGALLAVRPKPMVRNGLGKPPRLVHQPGQGERTAETITAEPINDTETKLGRRGPHP
jgi:hypothetical protein